MTEWPTFHRGWAQASALLPLSESAPKWTDKTLDCQMQGTVLVDGYIYGTAQSGNRGLVCLDWQTGEAKWNAPATKMAVVVAADGMLYVYMQDGTVILAKADPEAYQP